MLEALINVNLPREILTLVISSLPVFELRVSLPVAINVFHFSWYYSLFLAIIGNMLPVPFLLLFFNSVTIFLSRISFLKRPLNWLFQRTGRQSIAVKKYGFIGLLIFVALPVPLTGAWTASLVAVVLGMKFLPAFMAILGGVIIAGVIVTCLSLLGWAGAVIACVGLLGLAIFSMFQQTRQKGIDSPITK